MLDSGTLGIIDKNTLQRIPVMRVFFGFQDAIFQPLIDHACCGAFLQTEIVYQDVAGPSCVAAPAFGGCVKLTVRKAAGDDIKCRVAVVHRKAVKRAGGRPKPRHADAITVWVKISGIPQVHGFQFEPRRLVGGWGVVFFGACDADVAPFLI